MAAVCLFAVTASANDSEMLTADSLPTQWTYTPEMVQEIPGGVSDHWWRQFSDPMLDSLITLGVERNYDLAMAQRRMQIARAAMQQAKSGWYPQIGITAGYEYDKPSGAINAYKPAPTGHNSYFNAGLQASWEIDIFGRVASGVKAKRAQYRSSRAEYAGTMVSICAQIAQTYFTLREQQRLLQVAEAHCESQLAIVKIARARYEATLASKLDVVQALQTYYSTAASVPMLRNAIANSINALGVLVGEFPPEAAAMLSSAGPLPNWKVALPVGLPADLLRRRPDIAEAEMTLAAAAAEVGIAKKDFLPTLSINATLGTQAHELKNLFGEHSLAWSVAPTLSWTLFDGFSRKYALAQAKETMQNAIDNYNLTVMTAVSETDNAINAYGESLNHISMIQDFCVQNEEALRLAIDRYKNSLAPMTDVVNAQLNALAGESELVQAQGDALSYLVQLYEALGGGLDNPLDYK